MDDVWQKCPICVGSGTVPAGISITAVYDTCPTCRGLRIISNITGLPPEVCLEKQGANIKKVMAGEDSSAGDLVYVSADGKAFKT